MALGPQDDMEVNLIFVAGSDDAIWSSLESLSLRDDNAGSEQVSIDADQLTVAKGDTKGEATLGNVKFSLPLPDLGDGESYSFSHAALTFKGATAPVIVDVGSWHAERRPADAAIETVDESVIAAPGCGSLEVKVRNLSSDDLNVDEVATQAPGVRIDDVVAEGQLAPGATGDLSFDVVCDESADFQVITPRVTLRGGATTQEAFLDTVSIGLTAITTETVERILSR